MNIVSLVLLFVIKIESRKIFVKNSLLNFKPCLGETWRSTYLYGSYPIGEENQYIVGINRRYTAGTIITIELDSGGILGTTQDTKDIAEISPTQSQEKENFIITYIKDSAFLSFTVKGINGLVPYFKSLVINGVEHCNSPVVGYLDSIVQNKKSATQVKSSLDHDCGKRKLDFVELIVNGETTSPGEWPWHAAIYRHMRGSNSYTCGGTLISKDFVLTAAHCVTIDNAPVVPDILSVVLGKYHLIRGDLTNQEKEVHLVIIHNEFGSPERLDNDIALLKLRTEAVYNNYVQPACIWTRNTAKQLSNQIIGTVVGWGITNIYNKTFSPELRQVSLPIISDAQCIKSNAVFFGTLLRNERKFCAGWRNGTSPCNGESGSAFLVHGQETLNGASNTDIWYIRGITSIALPYRGIRPTVCDPMQYIVFTDISKYEDWIKIKIHEIVSCQSKGD